MIINAIKKLSGISKPTHLIEPEYVKPIQNLKINHLGNHNPRLHSDELLIALAITAMTNKDADLAMKQLGNLKGSEAHSTVILPEEEMCIRDSSYPTPNEPSNFVMVLRKYLEGSIVEKIQQADLDRWMVFDIRHHNEIGDLEYLKLYVELMGKYANVILVNAQNRIIDAMKRIPPFENSRRTCLLYTSRCV